MKTLKIHRNIGLVELVRVVTPKTDKDPGLAEVRCPSGELRAVDLSWLQDPPAPKVIPDLAREAALKPTAPEKTPDANPA